MWRLGVASRETERDEMHPSNEEMQCTHIRVELWRCRGVVWQNKTIKRTQHTRAHKYLYHTGYILQHSADGGAAATLRVKVFKIQRRIYFGQRQARDSQSDKHRLYLNIELMHSFRRYDHVISGNEFTNGIF